jgi:hypothetical protein
MSRAIIAAILAGALGGALSGAGLAVGMLRRWGSSPAPFQRLSAREIVLLTPAGDHAGVWRSEGETTSLQFFGPGGRVALQCSVDRTTGAQSIQFVGRDGEITGAWISARGLEQNSLYLGDATGAAKVSLGAMFTDAVGLDADTWGISVKPVPYLTPAAELVGHGLPGGYAYGSLRILAGDGKWLWIPLPSAAPAPAMPRSGKDRP